jgi:hypothetical protein
MNDPKGYYATLGVEAHATTRSIHAAFRSKAKLLHPDVPGTGNAGAFLQIKEAYDVLSNSLRRNEYDRQAREHVFNPGAAYAAAWPAAAPQASARSSWSQPDDGFPDPDLADILDPLPEAPRPFVLPFRLPTMMLVLLCVVVAVGIGGAVWQFTRPAPVDRGPAISAAMTGTLPDSPPADDPGPPRVDTPGTAEYVLPVAGTAILWRYDRIDRHFRPAGRLAPFTPLALLRTVSHGTLAEVRLTDDRVGYIYPHLLAPGDAAEATRARCIYDAGAPPRSGERLDPQRLEDPRLQMVKAPSPSRVTVINTADAAAVFELRAPDGVAAIYVAPHAQAVLSGLPSRRWRVEYAIGDLWSRSCFRFMAGMRAQRLPEHPLRDAYVLPIGRATDIPDEAFQHP